MSELKENVVIYIAGYIQRKVISKVDCQMCKDYLYKEEALCTSKLIDRRDLGGLIKPNKELVDIVKIADTILEMKIKCSKDLFCERNLFKKLSIQALNFINDQRPNILAALDHGSSHHKVKILKSVFVSFFSMRVKYICKIKKLSWQHIVSPP